MRTEILQKELPFAKGRPRVIIPGEWILPFSSTYTRKIFSKEEAIPTPEGKRKKPQDSPRNLFRRVLNWCGNMYLLRKKKGRRGRLCL